MRILMLVHSDYLHDIRVQREAESLKEAGHSVQVLAAWPGLSAQSPYVREGVTIHPIPLQNRKGKRRFMEMMWRMKTVSAQLKADVLHAHDLDTLWPASFYARKHNIPLIYDSHELYLESTGLKGRQATKWAWAWLEKRLIPQADTVITVCDGIADYLQSRYPLRSKPQVIRNFSTVPDSRRPLPTEHASFSMLANLRLHCDTVGIYSGLMQHGRGLNQIVQAVKSVEKFGALFCGTGPLLSELQNLVKTENLESRIRFTGQLDHDILYPLMQQCDLGFCYIEPISLSYYFALPNKLSEYIQAGIPVIGSQVPEIKKLVENYHIGHLAGNHQELATLLQAAEKLKNDKHLQAGIKEAQEVLNWEREKMKLIKLYQSF